MNQALSELRDPDMRGQVAPPVRWWTGKLSVLAEPAGSAAQARGGEPGTLVRRALFDRLTQATRVIQLSAPAGSGKTLLLRSWIQESGLSDRAAWVSVAPEERDPQRFWLSLIGALRATAMGPELVRDVSAAPGLDVWALIERLLVDLSSLEHPLWLVLDDLHELRSNDVLRQLELFLLRAPDQLRFVLMTRHDLRLGLHRLRLDGGLSELRTADLRFSVDETRALLESADVELSEAATALLHERTEGWAAGLRLAALSLAGHPDPERFAAEFSGQDRPVAEYLTAEVLERQPEQVRRLLLRTSVLERVNGPLAELLTGESGGEWILQELEAANTFVLSLDARRSWFRYHHLFADLLSLELRRTSPDELPALHRSAAEWFAEHGYPLEAIRHAQAAADWSLATRLLSDHWFGLYLDGQADTAYRLLAGFPAAAVAADPELAGLMAIFQLRRETHVGEADWYYTLATRRSRLVSPDRRAPLQILLAKVRLYRARHRGDFPAVIEEGQRLLALLEAADEVQRGLGEECRALALIALGSGELWALRNENAERHLEEGVALARRIARPWLEILGLGYSAQAASFRSISLMVKRAEKAIELAGQHGWHEEPIVGFAYATLATARLWQGRLEEAEALLEHAERVVRPVMPWGIKLHCLRGLFELASGRDHEALSVFEAAHQLGERLVTPNQLAIQARALQLHSLLRLSDSERVEPLLATLGEQERESADMRLVLATLKLAQGNPEAAADVLRPVTAGSVPVAHPISMVEALVAEAIACDGLGDPGAAEHALERALDLAEPDGLLLPFLLHPAPRLLERHSRHRTTHASLIAQIVSVQSGATPTSRPGETERLPEPLSESELRVLRYLPTNLSRPEIASELYLSVHTIKTHVQHLYAKLGAHSRAEAVERARTLGLLAPSNRTC